MGNKPVEKKRKKKGRPSLLDLQKRSLRLQKQQQQQQQQQQKNRNLNPNPNPNPYLRFPNPASTRRTTRRNPNFKAAEEDDDEDEEDSSGKRREKKLKLVLRIPNGSTNSPLGGLDLASSGSESDGDGERSRKKRKIDAVEIGRQNSGSKATESFQGEPSDSGPTTPLPDKKLLVFILDRLQKKDTYGVFSDPVDPNELPDYHGIIEHPMDFGTVRKKLSSGAYVNLEQFERDVFLISSNAMRYNAPDTIYYRQARSIQELAKKDFDNLRQESDDNELEPKIVRRGRLPSKNTIKRMVGRPPADRTGSDFSSDAALGNTRDGTHWSNSTRDLRRGLSFDKPSMVDASTRASHAQRYSETYNRVNGELRSERNEEYSGSPLKGIPIRNWKKFSVIDENRRNTYKQPLLSTCARESSVLTAFDGEKKLLLPVGLHMEHSYARSLARFAANLGPVAWELAAKRIEGVLPPGTKFGPGWVGDSEAPLQSQLPLLSTSPSHPSSQQKISRCTTVSSSDKLSESHELATNNSSLPLPACASGAPTPSRSSDSVDGAEGGRLVNHEGESNLLGSSMRPKTPFQLCQNSAMQPSMNGFSPGFGFNLPSQTGKMVTLTRSPEAAMTHARALDMVSRSSNNSFVNHQAPSKQLDAEEKARLVVGNPSTINSGSMLPDSGRNSLEQWRGLPLNPKHGSVPPDLNVGFQSPGSLVSGVLDDPQQQQQPDLALQL